MRGRILIVLVGLLTAACTAPEPYAFTEEEFNRSLPTFRKTNPDMKEVIVCYGKSGATPQQIVEIARQECAKIGKVPRFNRQDYLVCPVTTPVSVHYDCLAPSQAAVP
jgi:hypothetical protein